MAEFDPPSEAPTPEQQLFARVRLQRVVFGAFAIVLVSLFAIGVSVYRQMQGDLAAARLAADNAQKQADIASSDQEKKERDLQDISGRLGATRRALGLEKCRIAMHEIRAGERERALALLAEARELGPPAWWPMVAHLSREPAVRFTTPEHPTAPVIAGAMSRDLSTLAAARNTPAGVVVQVYDALSGALKASYPAVEFEGDGSPTAHLLLNLDGSAWYLSLPGRAYFGVGGNRDVVPSGDTNGWDPVTPLAIDADPDLTVVYEAHGPRGLVVRRRDEHNHWVTAIVALELAPVNAVCLAGLEPVIQAGDGIFRLSGDALTRLDTLADTPQAVALRCGPGLVYSAVVNARTVELTAISLEDGTTRTARHYMPDEPFEGLRFMGDDSLVWVGRAGRAIIMTFAAMREVTLSDDTLSFLDRHPNGLVFGNRTGELSLLPLREQVAGGVPLRLVGPDLAAEAHAHGFVLMGTGARRCVVQQGRVRVLESPQALELSPQGPIWFERGWHFPDGTIREAGPISLGAFADGSLLVHETPRKLRRVGPQVMRECLLPGESAPDDEAIAANAPVAALRVNDTVLFADFEGDPRAIAGRLDVPPDRIALDAAGKRLAVAYGPKVVVYTLADKSTLTFITGAGPGQIALLFGGSVLVSLEKGQMVFYETDGGREILRSGKDVTGFKASGDASLNIVAGGRLQELRFAE